MRGRIIGLMRVRDEADILADALDHLAAFCDGGIFVYDDASTDATPRLAAEHPAVRQVVRGEHWDPDRERAEFENRAAVLAAAQVHATPDDWFVYIDADERIEYDFRRLAAQPADVIAVRMKLLDFYITDGDVDRPYAEREWAGPEFRYVVIAFRNRPTLAYRHPDQRDVELGPTGRIAYEGWVRHYGKALSVARWERKCDYYAGSFPKYAAKWAARRGKAIHTRSDFGHELIRWDERRDRAFLLGLHPESADANAERGEGPLRILVTNHHLQGPGGTESYTLTLARALVSRGHAVTVYSKFAEALALEISATGARLATDLDAIKQEVFDVAHVQHNVSAYEVRHHFPELSIVFVSHGVLPFLESPPVVDLTVARFVAVSEEIEQRLRDEGILPERLRIVRNVVDDELFAPPADTLGDRPQRAIVLSNRIDEGTAEAIAQACERTGIECLFLGARFTPIDQRDLPLVLGGVDVVFTLGRGAMEAMLCGRIPFVLDHDGGDGLVTPENVHEIMQANFSGRRYRRRFDADAIVQELARWRAGDGPALREIAVREFGVASRLPVLESIYREAAREGPARVIESHAAAVTRAIVESVRETQGQTHNLWLARQGAGPGQDPTARREGLADALLNRGWLDATRRVLEALLAETPTHVLAACAVAHIAVAEGRHDEAEARLRRVLAQEPEHPLARRLLEQIHAAIEN